MRRKLSRVATGSARAEVLATRAWRGWLGRWAYPTRASSARHTWAPVRVSSAAIRAQFWATGSMPRKPRAAPAASDSAWAAAAASSICRSVRADHRPDLPFDGAASQPDAVRDRCLPAEAGQLGGGGRHTGRRGDPAMQLVQVQIPQAVGDGRLQKWPGRVGMAWLQASLQPRPAVHPVQFGVADEPGAGCDAPLLIGAGRRRDGAAIGQRWPVSQRQPGQLAVEPGAGQQAGVAAAVAAEHHVDGSQVWAKKTWPRCRPAWTMTPARVPSSVRPAARANRRPRSSNSGKRIARRITSRRHRMARTTSW